MTVETEGQYGVFTPISVGVGTSALNSEGLEKIKLCPLCRHVAREADPVHSTEGQIDSGYGPLSFGVECGADLECGCKVDGFPDQSSAIAAWNRRAFPPVDGLEVVAEIEGLLDAYWGLALMEGREGRDTDTPEDAAQKTRSAISSRLVTLSQASSVIAGLKEDCEALKGTLEVVRNNIPMEYLRRHDVPGATGPTKALDIASAMRDYAEDRWKLIDRLKAAEARISSLEEEDKRLREALACLVVEKPSEPDNSMEWDGSGTYDHATDDLGNTYTIEEVGSIDDSWSLSMTFANGEYNHLGWYDTKYEAQEVAEETRARLAAQEAEKGESDD